MRHSSKACITPRRLNRNQASVLESSVRADRGTHEDLERMVYCIPSRAQSDIYYRVPHGGVFQQLGKGIHRDALVLTAGFRD